MEDRLAPWTVDWKLMTARECCFTSWVRLDLHCLNHRPVSHIYSLLVNFPLTSPLTFSTHFHQKWLLLPALRKAQLGRRSWGEGYYYQQHITNTDKLTISLSRSLSRSSPSTAPPAIRFPLYEESNYLPLAKIRAWRRQPASLPPRRQLIRIPLSIGDNKHWNGREPNPFPHPTWPWPYLRR